MIKIVLATGNSGKVREIREFLTDFEIIPYTDIMDSFEIIEDGDSFKANAIIKAKAIFDKLEDKELVVLADDSGICVDALGGEPNIYSARYAGEGASDKDNLEKLINSLKALNIKESKAHYVSSIAIATKKGVFTTHGFMYGKVIDEAIGNGGFGYDPMFIAEGFEQTLGELDKNIKLQISHRSKALELAKHLLKTI